jgi:hypothetical protein
MRIQILWLPLWLGLVGCSLFAAVIWLPPSAQLSSGPAPSRAPSP